MSGAYAQQRRNQQQRHVVNGRLAPRPILGLDPRRTLVVSAICLALWFTNPAHNSNHSELFDDDWITNYGFFSVLEYGDRITLSVATLPLNCYFRGARRRVSEEDAQTPPPVDFCTTLRDQLAHQKPLIWDPEDPVHTIHRLFITLLLLATFVALCRPANRSWSTGSPWLDPFVSIIVHNPRQPLFGLLWCLVQANFLLHPIWQTVCRVAPLQDNESWLKLFPEDYAFANILLTILAIFLATGAVNAAGHYWTGLYLLRFEGFMGAALGYYRAILGGAPPGYSLALLQQGTSLSFLPPSVSVNAVTWTFLIACATQQSPIVAAAFFGANVAGAQLGQYQFQHLGIKAAFEQMAEGLNNMFGKLFSMV